MEPSQLYYLIVAWWVSEPLVQKNKKSGLTQALVKLQFDSGGDESPFHSHCMLPGWAEVCILPLMVTSVSTSWEGLWKCLVILHWQGCSWMLKACTVRDSIDLPWILHYFSLVPSWIGSSYSRCFIRRERNRLCEVLIFDFSSPRLQVQVPVPPSRSALQNSWQMSVLHILFRGEEGLFHWQESKEFQFLKWTCEPPYVAEQAFSPAPFCVFEAEVATHGLGRVLWVVRKKILLTLEKKVPLSSFKPCTWTYLKKAYNLGFQKPGVSMSSVSIIWGNKNLLSHIRKIKSFGKKNQEG